MQERGLLHDKWRDGFFFPAAEKENSEFPQQEEVI